VCIPTVARILDLITTERPRQTCLQLDSATSDFESKKLNRSDAGRTRVVSRVDTNDADQQVLILFKRERSVNAAASQRLAISRSDLQIASQKSLHSPTHVPAEPR
jgi:hypothetical protein